MHETINFLKIILTGLLQRQGSVQNLRHYSIQYRILAICFRLLQGNNCGVVLAIPIKNNKRVETIIRERIDFTI